MLPDNRKFLTARRLVLLASVAGVGAAVLVGGPGGYHAGLPAWTAAASAADATMQHPAGFADLVAKVKPAVISVRVKIPASAEPAMMQQQERRRPDASPSMPGSPMEKFFQQFGEQFGQQWPQGRAAAAARPSDHHRRRLRLLHLGRRLCRDQQPRGRSRQVGAGDRPTTARSTPRKVVGTDPKTDLALIKVDGKSDFPFVKFADQAPRVGDWVVAVGNPFGLGGTVTAGIVSARGRDIGAGPYDDYIQIDAPINKGNSGGPAFDVDGNVIGVNTAIYSPSGGSVGIGFDIPADTAKMVVAQLKEHGPRHPRLARRADPAGDRRHRRQPRPEEGRRRAGRRAASRQPGGQGRHRVRRRHHRRQRHAGEGRPRSRPHHRHDGAGRVGEARPHAQRRSQDHHR